MIHKIKALHDGGSGLSIRAISQQLELSRNTVRRYLRQDEAAIQAAQEHRERVKKLDVHRDYIVHLLRTWPGLSSVKVARKLCEKVGDLPVSKRTLRRYVGQVKTTVASRQRRYYEPVLDMVPGVQCQVDPGELRGVLIGGEPRTVHFVVFVLSYSRLSYVGVSFAPLNTASFIGLHDEAFRYFGGMPQECVYDQTKMVVIAEQFRELTVNQRFHEYAATAGLRIQACCGYDPQSKGKVEAGVKYVKQDALYGETFRDEAELRAHLQQWLDEVANMRTHGTTGQAPRIRFEADERAHLHPYLTPGCVARGNEDRVERKVDKTGLISWKANKYSVPMAYQQGRVGVGEEGTQLNIHDLESGEPVAVHPLSATKGQVVRNTDHYRDHQQRIHSLEAAIKARLGEPLGHQLCERLQQSMPRHYKDQLAGARKLLEAMPDQDLQPLADWVTREGFTTRTLKARLEAARQARARGRDASIEPPRSEESAPLDLTAYTDLVRSSGQPEVTHGAA